MKKISTLFIICIFAYGSLFAAGPAVGQTIVKTPDAAAKGFYRAWRTKSFKSARNYAEAGAIDKFFGVRRHVLTFKGCTKNDEGDFECIYENSRLDLSFAMIVKSFRRGYRVASITFSSEAI
jgi:hypothetical protein